MKKFLVPTDFSDTAKNAARYAAQLAADVAGSTIILYNVYDKIALGSDSSPLTETDQDRQTIYNHALENLKNDIAASGQVNIEYVAEQGSSLTDNIRRYVRHHGIDMVIMGITGSSRLSQIFMGSNALNLVNADVCPVMIVPPDAQYKQIKNVLFASDFKDVATTTPIAQIKKVLDIFKPTLYIVNVDTEHYVELTEEYKAERSKMETMFKDYNPEFFFIRMYDFLDAISSFTTDRNIDIILTVPRTHNFLAGLFTTSHTKKLAYHSHVPIVAVHE